jgi:hypothetical protein
LSSGRLPRDRGLKAWKGRGTFEKDIPMIICVHQRGEGMTYFDVHDTKQSLISKILRLINCHHHTRVYTDEYLAYENLKKYGFVHKQVCHSQKEYARGDVHVNIYVKVSLWFYPSVCFAAQTSLLIYVFWILLSFVSYRLCFRSLYSHVSCYIILAFKF